MTTRTRALLYAVIALSVGGAAYFFGVGSFLGQRAEASVLDASAFNSDPAGPLRLISTASVIFALMAIGLIALWVHGIARMLTILTASSVAIIASQILKERWLERPELFELDAANTFPSGHMTVFAVLVGALIWALPTGARAVAMVCAAVLLGVVSWQLLQYGWHRPSDLIGAQALALVAFALAAWCGPRRPRRSQRSSRRSQQSGRRGARSGAGWVFANRLVNIILTGAALALVASGLVLAAVASATHSDVLLLSSGEVALLGVSTLTARTLAALAP